MISEKTDPDLCTSLCRLPFYYEAKVLFVLYLWHPKTQGALYLYAAYVQPFLLGHEGQIDNYMNEARTWLSDFLAAHFQRCIKYLLKTIYIRNNMFLTRTPPQI